MSQISELSGWSFYRFALFVTGDGERDFLPRLFRTLEAEGHCHFRVAHQLGQRSPNRSRTRQLKMVGRGKKIPDKDEDIGLKARKYFAEGYNFVVLIDDLEQNRVEEAGAVYDRYRAAFDVMLSPLQFQARASVHFLVNMLEAYYFADAPVVNVPSGPVWRSSMATSRRFPTQKTSSRESLPRGEEGRASTRSSTGGRFLSDWTSPRSSHGPKHAAR